MEKNKKKKEIKCVCVWERYKTGVDLGQKVAILASAYEKVKPDKTKNKTKQSDM